MLTRDEAGAVIYQVINSGILDEKLEDDLTDVATAILCEKDGLHLWGVDDKDISDLYVSVNQAYITPEFEAHVDALYDKYKFYASKFEEEQEKSEDDEQPEEEGDKE